MPRPLRECALTIVEVVIAALLLTVVIAGIALATMGSGRMSTANNVSVALNDAAQRVFEHVRSERDWMQSCPPNSQNPCNIAGAVDSSLLEHARFGDGCGPAAGSTFKFELLALTALPVDSEVDGRNQADSDGKVPDYYSIRIRVGVSACAANRFPTAQPVTITTAVDSRGRVPKGSLVVEVCAATNQVDDRMSIAGCPSQGASDTKMLPCAPLPVYATSPTSKCQSAWSWVVTRPAHATDPSPYVRMARGTASFTLSSNGTTIPSSQAQQVSPGVYRFDELPAGTYDIDNIQPGGAAAGMEQWDLKMIPSPAATGLGATAIVQPDVRSRALLTFRDGDDSRLRFDFRRRVKRHNAYPVNVPMHLVESGIVPMRWSGDRAALMQVADATFARAEILEAACQAYLLLGAIASQGTLLDIALCEIEQVFEENGNCITFGYKSAILNLNYSRTTCTVWDFHVRFRYITTAQLPTQTRLGAAVSASYSSTPAPTYRYTVLPSELPNGTADCPVFVAIPFFGGRVPALTRACVVGRDAANHVVTLDGLKPGLNTGILPKSRSVTPGWGTGYNDDGGGAWDESRNEAVTAIPQGLKNAIWVRPDGSMDTPGGGSYANGQTIPVVGRGECLWYYQMTNATIGSCDPCEPFVQPLGGTFPSCYILTKVWWKRVVRYTGNAPAPLQGIAGQSTGDADQTKICNGPPNDGNHARTAPNCRRQQPPAPSGGGGSNTYGGDDIPEEDVQTNQGPVRLGQTAVGG